MTSRNTIPTGVFARDKGNRPRFWPESDLEKINRIMQEQSEERKRLDDEWDDAAAD